MHLRLSGEIDRAEDPWKAEHILCFEERAITIAVDLYRDDILLSLGAEVRRYIEGGEIAGVLGEAHVASVDPEVEERVDPIEVEEDCLVAPLGGELEGAAVGADLIAVTIGRPFLGRSTHNPLAPVIRAHLVVEDDGLIDVDRRTILLLPVALEAVDIPVHRYGDLIPRGGIVVGAIEVHRALFWRAHPVEAPRPVEALVERAILREYALSTILRGEREEVSVGLLLAKSIVGWTLPLLARRGSRVIIAIAGEESLTSHWAGQGEG